LIITHQFQSYRPSVLPCLPHHRTRYVHIIVGSLHSQGRDLFPSSGWDLSSGAVEVWHPRWGQLLLLSFREQHHSLVYVGVWQHGRRSWSKPFLRVYMRTWLLSYVRPVSDITSVSPHVQPDTLRRWGWVSHENHATYECRSRMLNVWLCDM